MTDHRITWHGEHKAGLTRGERAADILRNGMGSWTFVGLFILFMAAWAAVNTFLLATRAWDPYPFILLNLVLAIQAAYAGPIIMMSQARQAAIDRHHSMSDYEIENVPGFGTLKAGVDETRPEALEAALSPEASIVFLRVKNSWGPTGAGSEFTVSGHYDLYMKYLDGPMKNCLQPDGSTNRDACRDEVPFGSLALPAGY